MPSKIVQNVPCFIVGLERGIVAFMDGWTVRIASELHAV